METWSLTPERPLCYMHLPKTGGTTMRRFLKTVLPNEKYIDPDLHYVGPDWPLSAADGYTVYSAHLDGRFWQHRDIEPRFVTVLRHPVERIVSLYYFWSSLGFDYYDEKSILFLTPRFCKRNTLESFVYSTSLHIGPHVFNSQARQVADGLNQPFRGTDEELLTQALRTLFGYEMVGVTEQLDDMMRSLGRHLTGRPVDVPPPQNTNASLEFMYPASYREKPISIATDIEQQITRLNLVDHVLHQWAKQRWRSGSYIAATSFDAELAKVTAKLNVLRQQLEIDTETSVAYYDLHNRVRQTRRWLESSHVRFGELVLEGREQCLLIGNNPVDGVQVFEPEIDSDTGADLDTAAGRNAATIGVLNKDRVSAGRLVERSAGGLRETDRMRVLVWQYASATEREYANYEFDPTNESHRANFRILHDKLKRSISRYAGGHRGFEYLVHRYFEHPNRVYIARIIIDDRTQRPKGIVILNTEHNAAYIAEYIGSYDDLDVSIASMFSRFEGRIQELMMPLPIGVIADLGLRADRHFDPRFYVVDNLHHLFADGHRPRVYATMGDSALY